MDAVREKRQIRDLLKLSFCRDSIDTVRRNNLDIKLVVYSLKDYLILNWVIDYQAGI